MTKTSTLTADPAAATGAQTRTVGGTLWLTGLPSAGKTTLARALAAELGDRGVDVEILDGDEVRTHLSAGLGFTKADRETQVTRIGYVAELLARHGVLVLVPVIAPYADARAKVAAHHADKGTAHWQVHLSTSVDVCAERDVKGLYAKAFRGEISQMTGVDDPYEIPENPDLRIDTAAVSQDAAVAALIGLLTERGAL